ncbi:MAG: rhamnulokinase [Candidatus Aminicenantes bacterium]|nr:rhamnulokinase [Candidatus Aminicenantes bacterium]
MSSSNYLAFDLGAESGRAVLGTLEKGLLSIREIHRFPNAPVQADGRLRWDVGSLVLEVKKGLGLAALAAASIESAAVDTWGVDFGLLDAEGKLIAPPVSYRDDLHVESMVSFLKIIPRKRLYQRTGLQLLPFNSIFQLRGLAGTSELRAAARLLFMPGLLTYLLSGVKANDETIASTSQLAEPLKSGWCEDLLAALNLPARLLGPVVLPGAKIGHLSASVARECGCPQIPLTAVAGHDTASAVAAVPASGDAWAYISSGTWSLFGIETDRPVITEESERFNFTNERGLGGTTRFLKNINGFWLVQQCLRRWLEDDPGLTYDRLWAEAEAAPALRSLIDPDDPAFLNPPDMIAEIKRFCHRSIQPVPETRGEIARCILESLALKYRYVLEQLREASGKSVRKIHVIGGGSRNALLNAFTAAATHLPVSAGPVEATAVGNILVQAMARGRLQNPEEIRAVVARSFEVRTFEPKVSKAWDKAYDAFFNLVEPKRKDGRR